MAVETYTLQSNPLEAAIEWIKKNTIGNKGVAVTSKQQVSYPEVSGYLIPTLLSVGEFELADQYTNFLISIQNSDGSFGTGDNLLSSFSFDTGQVIRGLVSIVDKIPEAESALRKACNWIISSADNNGRIRTPQNLSDWSLGKRGSLSEGVHLYVLNPIRLAGEILNEKSFSRFADKSKDFYLHNLELTKFESGNSLTHFYAYIQEALLELGYVEEALRGMQNVEKYQLADGRVPAYFDVSWTCSTGLAQLALVWYKLGNYERANKALNFLSTLQNPSGGFFGSYGQGADYFSNEEISWANKYFIDAKLEQIRSFFNKESMIFPEIILESDGRVQELINAAGNLNNKKVLDVGCGKGRFMVTIKNHFPHSEITGLDISEELLKHVPESFDRFKGSMLNLPFENETFDIVYCVEALEHAVRIDKALKEMLRVLKPGGTVIIIDKNAAKWGAMATPEWESWFLPETIDAKLKSYCDITQYKFIAYDRRTSPDGLFVLWAGHKINNLKEKLQTGQSSYQTLNPEEWHNSIFGDLSVNDIANKVKNGTAPEWIRPILDNSGENDSLLELGSGTGELSAHLAKMKREVSLIDYSKKCLAGSESLFHMLGLKGNFKFGNVLEEFPFSSDSFDLVWSSGLLEHFSDVEIVKILKESCRVSRRLVISLVPNAKSIPYRIGKWHQENSGEWPWGYEDPKYSLSNLFKEAGLEDVREYSIGTLHSLNFITDPLLMPFQKTLRSFVNSLTPEEIQKLDQGYLLVTIGKKRKKRVLGVIPTDPIEAYENAGYSSWLKDYYNPKNYFDEVFCFSPYEREFQHKYGMTIVPTQPADLHSNIEKYNVDIIRAYGGFWPSDFIANAGKGIPKVVSIHDKDPKLLHESIKQADHVIAVSKAVRELILSRNIASERVHLIPNRVDLNVFANVSDPVKKEEFNRKFPGKYKILHVGRKTDLKNLHTVIGSLVHLGTDYHAIFIGKGETDKYIKAAAEMDVLSQCTFIDSIESKDLPLFYSFCDCMCTPSKSEGFGIVFIEALACSAVVVTSNIAPMNEYIKNMHNGILVDEYEDPYVLSCSIRKACTDNELRRHVSSNARNSILAFGKEEVEKLEVEFYESLLNRKADTAKAKGYEMESKTEFHLPAQERFGYLQKKLSECKKIIDLGCGKNPVKGAVVGVDNFIDPLHRSYGAGGAIDKDYFQKSGIEFLNLPIDKRLPFEDKEFDYAYSHHVFEHLDDPAAACEEMMRIAKEGVIITPSFFSEIAFGRHYHKWLVVERANKIVFIKKRDIEDCPFGDHPVSIGENQWGIANSTNPFDIALNDGSWHNLRFDPPMNMLSGSLRKFWYGHSPVVENIFLWKDKFEYLIISE